MKPETGNWKLGLKMRTTDSGAEGDPRRNDSRQGVALIVVLGFLSIMVMMAVAFLTHARTERMVADFTLEAQRGRQIVRTALVAAMNDYSGELFPQSGTRFMAPPASMEVFTSLRPAGMPSMGILRDDGIYLMDGSAGDWIPGRYRTTTVTNLVADAEWTMVREDPGSQSLILGRYAYACFDMSGGIDANLIALNWKGAADTTILNAGSPTNRVSVRDVGMSQLAETMNAAEFYRLRSGWHGFDTFSEIIKLTDGHYIDGQSGFESGDTPAIGRYPTPPKVVRWRDNRQEKSRALDPGLVTDLTPYSLASYRGIYDFTKPPEDAWETDDILSCEQMAAWSDSDWTTAMSSRPPLPQVRDQLANIADTIEALKDYVSTAATPPNRTDYPSVKNVPMFNELGIEFRLEFTAGVVPGPGGGGGSPPEMVLVAELDFETWYPFPSSDNAPSGSYVIELPEIGGGQAAIGANPIWLRARLLPGVGGVQAVEIAAADPPDPVEITFTPSAGDPERAGKATYRLAVVPVDTNYLVTAADRLQVASITVNEPITMSRGTDDVDEMRFQISAGMMLSVGSPENYYLEVTDPRLNHSINEWVEVDADSMEAVNPTAESAGYGAAGGPGLHMYCRNGPMLSPGEFGFIPTGQGPWQTIDLCTPEGAQLLAKLVTETAIVAALANPAVNNTYYTNGTINPNTTSTNVLLAAFAGLTLDEVPGMSGTDTLEATDAELLAGSMIDESATKEIKAEGGAFMNAYDWVRVPAMTNGGFLATAANLNKNQRESLIRNTWGLFNPNNTLFTVLVVAQAIKEGPGRVGVWDPDEDMITGERRAVALVWRDPTPSASGHHEMYVRMFKMLDE
jgi:hypothetical protein